MGETVDLEPAIGARLARRDPPAHPLHQDLRARAGQAPEPRLLQPRDHLRRGDLVDLAQVVDLRRGERVGVDLGEAFPQAAQQVAPPLGVEARVVSPLHQELAAVERREFLGLAVDLLAIEDVPCRVLRFAVEGAEAAVDDADVGGIDVAVDDVGDEPLGVLALPHQIGEAAEGGEVRFLVEEEGFGGVDPLSVLHFGGDPSDLGGVRAVAAGGGEGGGPVVGEGAGDRLLDVGGAGHDRAV